MHGISKFTSEELSNLALFDASIDEDESFIPRGRLTPTSNRYGAVHQRKWASNNPDKIKALRKQRQKAINDSRKRWYAQNRDYATAYQRDYRAKKKAAKLLEQSTAQ